MLTNFQMRIIWINLYEKWTTEFGNLIFIELENLSNLQFSTINLLILKKKIEVMNHYHHNTPFTKHITPQYQLPKDWNSSFMPELPNVTLILRWGSVWLECTEGNPINELFNAVVCCNTRLKTQKTRNYLFDHYLHFLKLHIINNYINSLFIWSRRLPLRPHVVAGMYR